MTSRLMLAILVVVAAASAVIYGGTLPARAAADGACVPVASWVSPDGAKLDARSVVAGAARRGIVLLGETHDSSEHHRWQLQMLAALFAQRPDMVIGFEMFPRRVQPALDRWVAGELSEREFLEASDWRNVWSMDPALYLPLFHFARMNRIPMVALNVEPALRRAVSKSGFAGVPEPEREGVSQPAPASEAYVDYLLPVYIEHLPEAQKGKAHRDDAEFRRFVATQTLWDRAMAQGLADAASRDGRPLAVGIMGSGHIVHGYGVPHQLRDLGEFEVAALLPWDRGRECKELTAGLADAVFGVAAPAEPKAPPRQRLGIRIEDAAGGVRIVAVEPGSVAEQSGLMSGDVITAIAGAPAKAGADVIAAVRRHAPGTWLPLTVERAGASREVVAKFPPRAQ